MAKDFIGEQGVIQTAARTFDFSDESGIGSDDGTPIKADMVMQLHAVTQKLMIDAGDTFNGVQENAVSQTHGDQQIFNALVSKIDTRVQNAASVESDNSSIAKRTSDGALRSRLDVDNFEVFIRSSGLPTPQNIKDTNANFEYLLRAIPIGTILPFGSATVPAGWFECNGAAVSRTSYPLLFAAIGTTWGAGDGSTTFTLPDLRNNVALGAYPSTPPGNGHLVVEEQYSHIDVANQNVGSYISSIGFNTHRYAAIVKFIIRAL